MKRKLVSFSVAAALIGGIAMSTPALAGTVTLKGDTQATMYGFVQTLYSWYNQTEGDPDHYNMPIRDAVNSDSKIYKATYNKTQSDAYALKSRIGFSFKNSDANVKGRIEGDFKTSGSSFRLRRAYVKHNFNNFYLLLGQEWVLEDMEPIIGAADCFPAGFNNAVRVPQIQIGTQLDMGSAELDTAFAFEYEAQKQVKTGTDTNSLSSQTMHVNRITIPGLAARAVLKFDTGFGSPAKFYAWGSVIPVYMTTSDKTSNIDESETSYAFGTGIKIPVSMVTVGLNYNYTNGATGYAGLSNYSPASYYYTKDSVKKTTSNAFNIQAVASIMPDIKIGGEYDYVEFKNDDAFNGTKPKVNTYVGNVIIKTTKYTKLTLEYRHIKAKDFDVIKGAKGDDSFSGDQIYAIYKYAF